MAARAVRGAGLVAIALATTTACGGTRSETGEPPASGRYDIGRPATAEEIGAWDIDVGPAGLELPEGRGSVAQGAMIYGAKCASCHGLKGEGVAPFPRLVGRDPRDGFPFGRDPALARTIGNYWPYATTVFDYVRRTMPFLQPGSLSDNETYAVTAWLLARNEIIPADATLDAAGLRAVKMPAKDRFVPDDRKGGGEAR